MAKQVILGSDLGRDALKVKCNVNFTELYDFIGTLTSLSTEDKTNLVNAINEHEEQINDLASKVVWKALDYKTEADLPSAYPVEQITVFIATATWQGVSNQIVRTEKYNDNIAIQYLEPNGSLSNPIMYRLAIPDTDTWTNWKHIATTDRINELADKKMPISTNTIGAIGEYKKMQGTDGASLTLPTGGTWEYQAYWIQTSTGYAAFIGGGGAGIAAGGTQILSAQTGYTPVAFVRRIL